MAATTSRKKKKSNPPAKSKTAASNGRAQATNGELAPPVKPSKRRRRMTAEMMAAGQRDISVSEFFAKNRHLLGFDSPRRALLTTIKEAVDNALDACEEAGILPEVWVHIEQTAANRYKIGVQDNGPGILKKQIPNIFGKLLYGSKFHRLRMSRGQQGIGISAAGMYGQITTGHPVKIMSKTGPRKVAHYYEIQIDTKVNRPEIVNNRGNGVDIPAGSAGEKAIEKHGIEWVDVSHGTRVTIELEAKYQRGRGSVDEYLEQTAIANPHVCLHYLDPDGNARDYDRSSEELPEEPKEIKPHPYGVELGRLVSMFKETKAPTLSQFLTNSFSRVSPAVARRICEAAKLSTRATKRKMHRAEFERLYEAIQNTKIANPATDCVTPIGEQLILQGLHQVVPAEFYVAATRPPAVYRGNPFIIEVGLAYGGANTVRRISLEVLTQMLAESDARTLRLFLINTFNGLGSEAADRILSTADIGVRVSPGRINAKDIAKLHEAMRSVNLNEGQSMNLIRFANRVPLQFQQSGCAITQMVINTNWRGYGLSQSRGSFPSGPVTVLVHMASVWVPFTSESKEAIASYPEIQRELRLGLQAVGRKLSMYLKRRQRVRQQGERRNIFLRYLGEVANAVHKINNADRDALYEQLLAVAKRKTAEADVRFNDRGQYIEDDDPDFGDNVLVVDGPVEMPNTQVEQDDGGLSRP